MKGGRKVIVLPDMQVPFHDKLTLAAVEKYMADERWDEWVQLGDFIDLLVKTKQPAMINPDRATAWKLNNVIKAAKELLKELGV